MSSYELSELAGQDFDDIASYTTRYFGRRQAQEYTASLAQGAGMAAHFPSIGMPYMTQSGAVYQKYNVGRHAIFYRPEPGGIFVVRVLHLMMNFDDHLE